MMKELDSYDYYSDYYDDDKDYFDHIIMIFFAANTSLYILC